MPCIVLPCESPNQHLAPRPYRQINLPRETEPYHWESLIKPFVIRAPRKVIRTYHLVHFKIHQRLLAVRF
jgi:hypothetical protein